MSKLDLKTASFLPPALQLREHNFDSRARRLYEQTEEINAALLAELDEPNGTPIPVMNDDITAVHRLRVSVSRERPTILYVDDDPQVRKAFQFQFEDFFEVFIAASADEALRILQKGIVDLLITDQTMPTMTGLELCEVVNARWPNIPRVILSGYAREQDKEARSGIVQFLKKPWKEADIMGLVEQWARPMVQVRNKA